MDFLTIKYDGALNLISSATYDGGGYDYGEGVAVDSGGNIIVAGQSFSGGNGNYFTITYNNNLVAISSIAYDGGSADYPMPSRSTALQK